VIDAVGAKATRHSALAAVKPGGVIMHIGLQDWASEIDMRKLTLAEITLLGTYTYTMADLRATVSALTKARSVP
jgi:D-arabinose 1-dehydrogenase-like Zn-dependent alcohol dehydrogenase